MGSLYQPLGAWTAEYDDKEGLWDIYVAGEWLTNVSTYKFKKLFVPVGLEIDTQLREAMHERIESIVKQTLHGAQYVMARQRGEAGGQDGEPDDRPFREIWDEYYRYIVIDGQVDSTIAIARGLLALSEGEK